MTEPSEERLLQEQREYYRARADEYDEWFLRQGRYDHGAAFRQQWFDEVGVVERALAAAKPRGDILELACGTGLWTRHLEPSADSLMAVDASEEMIALNRARLRSDKITYVHADLFEWRPPAQFDVVFFGFWLSHVPGDRFESFWRTVRAALKPTGTVCFVDNLPVPEGTARDHTLSLSGVVERRLNDGQVFRIVKIFYQPEELMSRLTALGWRGRVDATSSFFIHGQIAPDR